MTSELMARSRLPIALGLAAIWFCLLPWQMLPLVEAASAGMPGQPATGRGTPAQQTPVNVLVVYHSLTGNTEKMARAVADGVRLVSRATVVIRKAGDVSAGDLKGADGIILGSPTYWGNVAAPMKAFIDDWWLKHKIPLIDKVGGSFASGGGETGGKENVIYSLNLAMMNAGMVIVGPIEGGFGQAGVSALEPVSDKALKECRDLGQRVAGVAQRLKSGAQVGAAESR